MRKLDFRWAANKEWYHWDEKLCMRVLNNDAPPEAQESYKHYLEQTKVEDFIEDEEEDSED